jgi:flagellar hook-length control protein FliK
VVITITAYTEPVPPPSPQVSEAPPVDEIEENEERPEFAEILAGLLRKNETSGQLDLPPGSFDDAVIGVPSEYSGAEQVQSVLSAGAEETESIREKALYGAETSDDGLSQTELSGDYKEVLLSAEHLLAGLEPQTLRDISGDLSHETSGNRFENLLMETEPPQDFSSFTAEPAEIYASVKTAEDASFTRMVNKKDRSSLKDENIPSDAKDKKVEQPFLVNKREDVPGRLDEMRSRSRRDKVTFEVRDMRTVTGANESAGTRPYSVVETSAVRAGGEAPVREITLELRLPEQNPSMAQNASQTAWEVKAGSALENMLARELHQNFNGDIVRHASMALRDGGEGTIKIALKPESLGNVKIRLEMTENKITGHIVVESEEALNAFRKEISSLEQAFRDSGFTNADLNLSLTSEGWGAQGQEQEESSFNQAAASSRYESSFEQDALPVDVFFGRSGSINMLA